MTLIEEVLQEVNQIRANAGLEALLNLPRGVIGTTSTCPLARALQDVRSGLCIGAHNAYVWGFAPYEELFDLSPNMQLFVSNFDEGLYPELEDHGD